MTTTLAYLLAGVAPRTYGNEPLSPLGLAVLLALHEPRTMSVREVLDALGLPSVGTLNPHLDKLEARGYIERARHRFDHRKTVCTLTPKGVRLLRSARRPFLETVCPSSPTDASTASSPAMSSSEPASSPTCDAPTSDAGDTAMREP